MHLCLWLQQQHRELSIRATNEGAKRDLLGVVLLPFDPSALLALLARLRPALALLRLRLAVGPDLTRASAVALVVVVVVCLVVCVFCLFVGAHAFVEEAAEVFDIADVFAVLDRRVDPSGIESNSNEK